MKNKTTRKVLLLSSLSLLLCFAMLLGTTFAWFTDSVTSSGNIIKAGNLDVEMYWADGTEAPDTATWTDASTGAIFDYDNWEPGYVDVKHIKIANEGSLALKYQVAIVATGQVSDLSDVIDVYYADPAVQVADRAALANATKIGTLTEVLAGMATTASGNLKKDEDHTITLALKMQEEAGNEYQSLAIGSDFAVVLSATQLSSEEDSFDNQYDAGLVPTTSENGTERQLTDGSTVFYYNEASGNAGRIRLTAIPENLGSEYEVPAEVNDLGGALVGADLDKLIVPAGVENAYKSLEGATIDEVVLKAGTTTIPNRMFYKANVTTVTIPSGITTIEQNAFAMAGDITTLTIPATVTTVEEAAFQHMPDLTTVIFEGNTSIQGYAFRGCAALRTVNLPGDDVTFIASTLSGKNSCWFCNGESNNPGTSNITFNVANDTVAERVKVAMGAECPSDVTESTVEIYSDGAAYYIGTKQ